MGPRGRRPCQWRQPLFEASFQRPSHNLCLHLTGQTPSHGPPVCRESGHGCTVSPSKGRLVGREGAGPGGTGDPSNESVSFVPPTGAPVTEHILVEPMMCPCSWCRDTGVATPASPTPGPALPGGTVPRKEAARGLPVQGTCQPSGWERGGLAESPCRPGRLPAPPHAGMRAISRAWAAPSPGRGPLAGAGDFPRKALFSEPAGRGTHTSQWGHPFIRARCGCGHFLGGVWSPFSQQQKLSHWPRVQMRALLGDFWRLRCP